MNPPANWYPDPTGRHGQRYWDGAQWTEHVFTDGVQRVDPLEVDAGEAGASEAEAATGDVVDETPAATGTGLEGDTASDAAAPADLPRRQRRAVTSETQVDEPMEGAEGLFGDDADAQDAQDAQQEAPAEQVAPDVEPEDVVATVEEATGGGEPDFSDAFVLAPETANRLVRRAEPGDEQPESADAVGAGPAGDDLPERESAASSDAEATSGDDDAEIGDDAVDDPDAEVPADATDDQEPPAADDLASMPAPRADVPLDAPPPAVAAAAASDAGSLGISGDLVGGAFAEREGGGDVALQNSRMLRCAATTGIVARQGTMVAYQGDVQFERQGAGGVGRALKRAATGEGLAMMRVTGNGDVFFADGGQHVFLLHLGGGPGLSVNGRNVLAFSASLQWDIERVKGASLLAGGLFNTTLTGTGWVALVADGEPVVLRTDEAPTFVDVNALVAWSGGLSTRIVNTVSAKSLVGLGSGEAFQMAFDGTGIVIVQPSEGPMGGAAAT